MLRLLPPRMPPSPQQQRKSALTSLLPDQPWLQALVGLSLLILGALVAHWVALFLLMRLTGRVVQRSPLARDSADILLVVRRLVPILPLLIIQFGIRVVPHMPPMLVTLIANLTAAFIILAIARAIGAALRAANAVYQHRPEAAARPIKGYTQVGEIIVYCAAAVLMVAAVIDRSPLLLLSGLGAMAAVLMLIFQNTILSFVASIQITSNDIIRVGDWIEMPQMNADGFVIDMALHTVKVQNFDKTITTIPTHRIISESFKNWRAMFESGGRRLQRSLMLDQTSVRFLEPDEIEQLKRFALLRPYLERKEAELLEWNNARPERIADAVNARRITNIGTFRAYVDAYLRNRPDIHLDRSDMFFLVRQLAPTVTGVPLEIYCFTKSTAWADYEAIQGDIFDHLLAILPEFHLRVFQEPTGRDLRGAFQPGAGSRLTHQPSGAEGYDRLPSGG